MAEGEFSYTMAGGTPVAVAQWAHVQEGVTDVLLREALARVEPAACGRTAATVDMGRPVGRTRLVEGPEGEVAYVYLAGRPGPSRVVPDGKPRETSLVTVVVAPPAGAGAAGAGAPRADGADGRADAPALLLAAHFGEQAPPEPWDDTATDESRPFWETHALVPAAGELTGRAGSRDAYLHGHVRRLPLRPPAGVVAVLRALEGAGHEAVLVGGCVRDALRGVVPDDFDIATQATPDEMRDVLAPLGYHVIPTGLAHGTVTIPVDGGKVEATTYRLDGEYLDRRHCDVEFTRSLVADLKRRDFSFNALALVPADAAGDDGKFLLIDPFGGERDLARGVVRCVGEPRERFSEDPLRMLRAMRFSARLGFRMHPATLAAALAMTDGLDSVSRERKTAELLKTLAAPHAQEALLACAPLVFQVLPELSALRGLDRHSPRHAHDAWEHTARVVGALERRDDDALLLAALFHDCAKPDALAPGGNDAGNLHGPDVLGAEKAEAIMRTRLRLPAATLKRAVLLVRFHNLRACDRRAMMRLARQVGECVPGDEDVLAVLEELLYLRRADIMGRQGDGLRLALLAEVDEGFAALQEMRAGGASMHVTDLAIGGGDIMALGVERGPEVGRVLGTLLDMVVEGTLANEPGMLREAARKLLT